MTFQAAPITRRHGLIIGSQLILGAAAGILVGKPTTASATKADKYDFHYQDKPNDGKRCETCRLYSPGEAGMGHCAVVEGDVSPSGWCMAYSKIG